MYRCVNDIRRISLAQKQKLRTTATSKELEIELARRFQTMLAILDKRREEHDGDEESEVAK
jgi:hypothetical protein